MADRFYMLDEITPDLQKWKARVVVQNKLAAQDARNSGLRLQKLILADAEGNTVAAIMFGTDVATYQSSLVEGLTYIIKGAKLGTTSGYENQLANCKFQWTLNRRTVITLDKDNSLPVLPLQYNITSSSLFYRSLDGNSILSSACVFIGRKDPRSVVTKYDVTTIQEFSVIDAELKPFIVSFWGDIVPQAKRDILNDVKARPAAVLINLKANEFSGISLSSTAQTVVVLDNRDATIMRLNRWKQEHRTIIDEMIGTTDLFEKKIFQSPDRPLKFSTVAQAAASNVAQLFTLKVRGKLERDNQKYCYISCAQCLSATAADHGEDFYCDNCKMLKNAASSVKLVVSVYDDTGEIEAVFFSKEASKLLAMPGAQFIATYNENPKEAICYLKNRLKGFSLVLRVRSKIFKGVPDFTVDTLELSENSILPMAATLNLSVDTAASHDADMPTLFSEADSPNTGLPTAATEYKIAEPADDDLLLSAMRQKKTPVPKVKKAGTCSTSLANEYVETSTNPTRKPSIKKVKAGKQNVSDKNVQAIAMPKKTEQGTTDISCPRKSFSGRTLKRKQF